MNLSPGHAHAVILNPRANGGNGLRRWKDLLATELAARVGLPEAPVFDGGGAQGGLSVSSLDAWVSERIHSGARHFVAVGGDGTVHLAINALLRAPERRALPRGVLRLGAVGLGSSNDFQKPFGAPGRTEAAGLACRLKFDEALAHDLGRLEAEAVAARTGSGAGSGEDGGEESRGPALKRHFIVNASVGVTAEANLSFNQARGALGFLKRHWVNGAIVGTALATFKGYRNFQVRLSIDGSAPRAVALSNLGVVKNVHFSGQMRYDVPQACDDGALGVHLCEGMSRLELLRLFSRLNAGRFSGTPKTSSRQARRVDLESDRPFAVETDGEVLEVRKATFTLVPKEFFVCP